FVLPGGMLSAQGTAAKPIIFTSTSDKGGDEGGSEDWGGVYLLSSGASANGNALLSNVKIRFAGDSACDVAPLYCAVGEESWSGAGLYIGGGTPNISGLEVNNSMVGIYVA